MELREVSKLFYQLKIANQELTDKFEKETGFSITRYELLMVIKDKGQCPQTQLQSELKIDSAAVSRHLKILEEKNYVQRQRNIENNREVLVSITEKAELELSRCSKDYSQSTEGPMVSLSESEVTTLIELLNKLLN